MARIRNRVEQKPVLFIACEGTSSEFQYFESWAQTESALEHFNRIEVYPEKREERPKTTPFEMLELAIKTLETGAIDYAWIVFDKDNHPKLPDTFKKAVDDNVRIAYSSRSFEQWVLLHFQKSSFAFSATECKNVNDKPINCGTVSNPDCSPTACLSGHIRREGLIPSYSKKKSFDLYHAIHSRTEIAIVNASWLRFMANSSIHLKQPPLFDLNPYTDVDRLVLNILAQKADIEWGNSGTNITLNNWTINLAVNEQNFVLTLIQNFPQAQIINENFKNSSFFTTDDELMNNKCDVISHRLISENNGSTDILLYPGDTLEFTLSKNEQPYFLFWDKFSSSRIFIIL